jgi:Tfp pilus assembly protein PilN
MRPVNLLPAQHRPRSAGAGLKGSSYVLVGVLGALLVMVALYVMTGNQANDRKAQTAEANRDAAAAEARLASLAKFGDFTQIAKTREASVKDLAQARFDWERFLRETANVLPENTWLTNIDATATPAAGAGSSPTTSGPGVASDSDPGAKIEGCAKHQPDVAALMVRLRELHRVSDVQLVESTRAGTSSASSSSSTPTTSTGGSEGCGPYIKFSLKAVFELAAEPVSPAHGPRAVPAKLGGGS